MRQNNLRANITNLSKNKVIKALVLESLGSRVSVKLGGSGKVLNGLEVVGGPVVAGQYILIDYASGIPIAKAIGQDQAVTSVSTSVTKTSTADSDNPNATTHTHTESQITDLDHDATSIRNKPLTVSSGSPNEGDFIVYSSGSWGASPTAPGMEPARGPDDNYVTDAEKIKLSNLSNTNTGDQVVPVGIEQVAGYALVAYDEDTGQFTRAEVATSGSGGGGGGGTDILGVQIFS